MNDESKINNEMAWIGKVINIESIKNADSIELVTADCGSIGKWLSVCRKGSLKVGELCTVFLPDTLIPLDLPGMEFMSRTNGVVKMSRFKGVPSEVVIMPNLTTSLEYGLPVGLELGVTKYYEPIPNEMIGTAIGSLPHRIPRTKEPMFQKASRIIEQMRDMSLIVTTKMPGYSCTVYNYDGNFGVCSRRWELSDGDNIYWNTARKLELDKYLPSGFAVQMEIYGPGILGNRAGVDEVTGAIYNFYSFERGDYLEPMYLEYYSDLFDVPTVPIMYKDVFFNEYQWSRDGLYNMANNFYPGTRNPIEGVVIRPYNHIRSLNERLSFKVINLKWKG